MTDSPSLLVIAMIVVIAIVVYFALVAAAQVLRRMRNVRFAWPYHLFAVAAGLLAGLHYAPRLVDGGEFQWIARVIPHAAGITAILAVLPAVTLLNRFLWVRTGPDGKTIEAPRVLADTTALVISVATILAVLQFVYDVKVPGLVAGSGIVAIIVGLAMQDLLGNIFGGLAIYLEKPFKPGDWLHIEGQDARVIEITWRSTRLITPNDVLIDVPNAAVVKQTITNYERPTPEHALRAYIGLHYDVPPARAQDVLAEAAASVPGVLQDPRPVVWVKEFADSAVVYDIKFWIEDHRLAPRLLSEVRAHAWYAVRRAGMEIPFPIVTLHRAKPSDAGAAARAIASRALRKNSIFSFLGGEQIDDLVQHSSVVMFAPAEHIIKQGAVGDSMFLLSAGRAEVRVTRGERTDVVATLGPGDCFGEMSLLSGEPRTAAVVALEEVEAVEITRLVLTPIIQASPHVLQRLSELLAERQAINEARAVAAETGQTRAARSATMLNRLRRFFFLSE